MKPSEKRKQTIARLKKEAQEERAKNLLVSDLYNLKKRLNPKSIYSFSVGDKVKGRTAHAFAKLDFFDLKENEPYLEVLDGKQRLTTLSEFYTDGFKYHGKVFSEMSKSDKRYFMASLVSIGMASNLSEKDKIRYFLDLNTKGKPQSEEHLNKVRKLLD